MFGIPAHEELRRFRAIWYRWNLHDRTRPGGVGIPKRRRQAAAVGRATRRTDTGCTALRDLSHPRWTRTRSKP